MVGELAPEAPNAAQPNLYDRGQALEKLDFVLRQRGIPSHAQAWEAQMRARDISWAGHCDALAAASSLTGPMPVEGRVIDGVHFTQDDLENLATAFHYNPGFQSVGGTRYEAPMGPNGVRMADDIHSPAYQDMNPLHMQALLHQYVGNGRPLIMDMAAGSEVWNFPVYAFETRLLAQHPDGSADYSTRILYAGAEPGVNGTVPRAKDLTFRVRPDTTGRMTGEWIGNSYRDHPDFAWIATGSDGPTHNRDGSPRPENQLRNPFVTKEAVEWILGRRL